MTEPGLTGGTAIPLLVERAYAVARKAGFPLTRQEAGPGRPSACLPGVGRFLAMLAAGCHGGVIAELGTGAGIGAAWICGAMPADCTLVTAELDDALAAAAARLLAGDARVRVLAGDASAVLPPYAPFELIFADSGVREPAAFGARLARFSASPVQAGPYGPDRDGQRLGNPVVRKLGPGEQQQDFPVAGRQAGQRRRELLVCGRGTDTALHKLGMAAVDRIDARPRQGPQHADFCAALFTDHVGGYPEQPRTGVSAAEVVALPAAERGQERVRHDVVRGRGAKAPGGIAMDRSCMPVIELGKRLGLTPGQPDRSRIG